VALIASGVGAAMQVLLAVSQTKPFAQSFELAQVVRHAPNAGSQMNGEQSKGTASLALHFAPGDAQYAGPAPVDAVTQRLRAHIVPVPAPMHEPSPPHVPRQVSAGPHSFFRSTPIGSTVHLPGFDSSAHE
jgi:hypothetical protein